MKFPRIEEFGGLTTEYLNTLEAHGREGALLQARLHGMFQKTLKSDELPKWSDMYRITGKLPVPVDLSPVINNLAGVVQENEKEIVDTAKGFTNDEWFFAVRVE